MVTKIKIIIVIFLLFLIEITHIPIFADEVTNPQNNKKPSYLIPQIKKEQLKNDLESGKIFVLIDVRGEDEYKMGHLPKSINITKDTFAKKLLGGFRGWSEAGYSIYNRHGEFKMISFEKRE